MTEKTISALIVCVSVCLMFIFASYRNYENPPSWEVWNKDFMTLVQLLIAALIGHPVATSIGAMFKK